jgi:ABC-type antimicrobial peptide transport system permease subunit
MFKNYFKTAWRNLSKNKFSSIINISGLAVGMSVAMLIGLWIWSELSFNKNFSNYNRIAQVMQNQTFNGEVQTWNGVPLPLADVLRNNYGSNFKYVVTSSWIGQRMLSFGEKRIKTSGNYMEPDATEMLSLKMLKGTRAGLRDMNSIMLSASAAKSFFGNEDPINKVMRLEDKSDVKVTGIYEDVSQNSSFANLDFIAPFQLMVKNQNLETVLQNPWGASWFQIFAQVTDNADMSIVSKKIKDAKTINATKGDEGNKNKPEIFLHPMSKWHLYSDFKNGVNIGGRILYVWLFGAIGVFVLLLACINFMNLSTARSEKRAKEVGVRKAIGSLRSQLIYQFFTESILVAIFSFIVSLALLQLILPFFNSIAGKELEFPWTNIFFWITGIGFSLITGLLAGIYPAVFLSSFKPVKVLKGTFRAGRSAIMPRKVLVILQFTVSIVLIVGTLTVFRQIEFAKNRPVGYNRNGLVTISAEGIHDHFPSFRNDLIQSGKVAEAAESEIELTNTYITNSGFNWKGKDPGMQEEFVTLGVTPEFGKTINWHIIEGRDFSKDFASDSSAIIINQTAAKYLGFQHPVGETLQWGDDEQVHIIGVVKDMVTQNPYQPIKQTFFYLRSGYLSTINIKVNPDASMASALNTIKGIFKKYNPMQPFEYKFLDEQYAKNFDNEVRVGKLATFFAVLAIFISCLGVFGMATFIAEQRVKEIGVRKVLGASVFNVWQLLSKDFVMMVIISFIIAAPLSYYFMHNWLQNYSYRTQLSWWIFAAAGGGTLIVTLLTVSFQSIKAAIANPVKSLRTE